MSHLTALLSQELKLGLAVLMEKSSWSVDSAGRIENESQTQNVLTSNHSLNVTNVRKLNWYVTFDSALSCTRAVPEKAKQTWAVLEKSQTQKTQKILCLCLYFSFFTLKAELQVLKLEFCQVNLESTDKLAINWQNFARIGLQLKFAFRIRLLV